ncbi:hypothetical protein [Alienimonas sp. DA493]|uniref:hypothetical protein n=1 Tax=Alienimonas sp. DA493 TaxID=3373605 RepID=UPI0037548E0E
MAAEAPVYQCMTKGTDRESGGPRFSASWVGARRGTFKVFADRIEVGDWRIPFEQIDRAVLHRATYLPFVKVGVLELDAAGRTYQFGFNPWAAPEEHLPFPVEEREGPMGYSQFSVAVRLVAAAALLYFLFDALT